MARKKKHPEHANHERWLVSYADFITLLFAFFVVMFAVSQVDSQKLGRLSESFKGAIDWELFDKGSRGLLSDAVPGKETPESTESKARDKFVKAREAIRKEILDKIAKNGDLSGIKVLDVHGELVLRLPDTTLFAVGQAELQAPGQRILEAIAHVLEKRRVRVRVEGHTDASPIHTARFPSNWDLATARSTAVITFWVDKLHFDPRRLAAAGYAEWHPIASNDTPDGRAQNRRVDIIIVAADADDPEIKASRALTNGSPDGDGGLEGDAAAAMNQAPGDAGAQDASAAATAGKKNEQQPTNGDGGLADAGKEHP